MWTHFAGRFPPDLRARSPAALLDLELVHEKASSLGRFGRNLEGALRALCDFDATHRRSPSILPQDLQVRSALVAEAGRMLWHLVVQREACGLYDSRAVMEDYQVPAEVQREMGAMRDPRRCAIG
jgi:hypothetical protein